MNPVRAKIVKKAENYIWSSAAAHCAEQIDNVLTTKDYWKKQFESLGDWSSVVGTRKHGRRPVDNSTKY
jgi:hypothetical protein